MTEACPPDGLDRVLLADVGNSRIKLAMIEDHGLDAAGARVSLPRLARRGEIDIRGLQTRLLRQWLSGAAPGGALVLVASVHDRAAALLELAIAEESATGRRSIRQQRVTHADLPLEVSLAEPHRVGIDRLAAATAATVLVPRGRGAIVVDCGTAATVDMIDARGRYLGGAILPGPVLMARALAEGTSKLPEVQSLARDEPPPMPGGDTRAAIAAGIGWGIRGAIAELVAQARRTLGDSAPVIATGGWRRAVLPALPGAIDAPDLVLAGIAMAARRHPRV
jgi:type III pantothenate kinase